jgi:hypothetical protein
MARYCLLDGIWHGYRARRKMRWAVREVGRIKEKRAEVLAAALPSLIAAARTHRHLEGRWGS